MLVATVNASNVIVSSPAIFNGIQFDPLALYKRELSALDAKGLRTGHRGAGGQPRPAERHVPAGAASTAPASRGSAPPRSRLRSLTVPNQMRRGWFVPGGAGGLDGPSGGELPR